MGMDRSKRFEKWLDNADQRKKDKLIQMEKQVRILIHVFDLIGEVDQKAFHALARISHEIKTEYEQDDESQ